MQPEDLALSKRMLEEFLGGGASLVQLGAKYTMGKSSVERRLKALVELAGPSLPEDVRQARRLPALRAYADEVLDAVCSVGADALDGPFDGQLNGRQVDEGVARLKGPHRERDTAMVYLLFGAGLSPIELAQLKVREVLTPDGSIRKTTLIERALPHEQGLEHATRAVILTAPRLQEALQGYVEARARRQGASRRAAYRGLDPEGPLLLTDKGLPFKTRLRRGGTVLLCPRIFETLSSIFRHAGWPGLRASAARRLLSQRLLGSGADVHEVQAMLGLGSIKTARRLVHYVHQRADVLRSLPRDVP